MAPRSRGAIPDARPGLAGSGTRDRGRSCSSMAKKSGSLRSYLLTRLLLVVPNVWILLTVVFVLMRVAPGDPVQAAQGGRLPPDQIKALRHAGGFDKPLIVQYRDYLGQVLQGNLGHSSSENRSVWSIVTHEGAATL